MKSTCILPLLLFFSLATITAQNRIALGLTTALDYTQTPQTLSYNRSGYGNQFVFRYGLKAMASVHQRLRIGFVVDAYRRKETFECIHFPPYDNPPQAAYSPFFNNPNYPCDFKGENKIYFLEIPLLLQYDLVQTEHLTVFVEAGMGYQIITTRRKKLTNNQTNTSTEERESVNFTWSKHTPRLGAGVRSSISPRLTLEGSTLYRTDAFAFEHHTLGLSTTLYYHW